MTPWSLLPAHAVSRAPDTSWPPLCLLQRDPRARWRACEAALSPHGSCLSCTAVTSSQWKPWVGPGSPSHPVQVSKR